LPLIRKKVTSHNNQREEKLLSVFGWGGGEKQEGGKEGFFSYVLKRKVSVKLKKKGGRGKKQV